MILEKDDMILVFGGTTEGRKAVEVLEEAGKPFFYSTKTGEQDVTLHHGVRIDGAMDGEAMMTFCREHNIRLIVNAAHPFAAVLHQTVAEAAAVMGIPSIRFERIYPVRDEDIVWCEDYDDALKKIDAKVLLATTGVQSIARLKVLEDRGVHVVYRILPRESSIRLAHQQGASDDQLCFYEDSDSISVQADAILLKESGVSGGFIEKVAAARKQGMRIYAIKRPATPVLYHRVNGPNGLRRMVERLLPAFYPLKSGLTTGTCATAAAVAATLQLLSEEHPTEVPVVLPNGETIMVAVGYGEGYAYCVKDAGDDPDVTDGIEVRATVERAASFEILGGEGVGRFTLPGFDYPPGYPAINKGPRQMLRTNIQGNFRITISVPGGAEIARKTFNPRLGIEGGISIIGVSGIVKPFSETAFKDSIKKCLQVAVASGSERVVIHSGGKSERFLHGCYPDLPVQAFVEYGNFIGDTIRMASELGVSRLTMGIMLGKAVKLAAGHLDTHSKKVVMDKDFISKMLVEAGIHADIESITLARELWTLLPADQLQTMTDIVIARCLQHCKPLFPDGELTILLISDEGEIYSPTTRMLSD